MTINNKEFTVPRITFSLLCDLEDKGVSIGDLSARPLAFLTACVAAAMGVDMPAAKEALDAHLESGGDLTEISETINAAVVSSGFFRTAADAATA